MNFSGTDKGVINEGNLFIYDFKHLQIFVSAQARSYCGWTKQSANAQSHSHAVTQTATRSVETGLKVSFADKEAEYWLKHAKKSDEQSLFHPKSYLHRLFAFSPFLHTKKVASSQLASDLQATSSSLYTTTQVALFEDISARMSFTLSRQLLP